MRIYEAIAIACEARRNCESSGNREWEDRWYDRIRSIQRNFLPSGSGFDTGTEIDMDSTAKQIKLAVGFHHMDDGGSYDGWTDHIIYVRPNLAHRIDLSISGRNRNDIKSYIGDTFHAALDAGITWEEIDEQGGISST